MPQRQRGSRSPQKKNPASLIRLVNLALAAAMLFGAVMLVRTILDYDRSRRGYAALSESVRSTAEIAQTPLSQETAGSAGDSAAWTSTPAPALPGAAEAAYAEAGFTQDWAQLRALNPDAAAWLYCPDTCINYPVVKYRDNEYFLDRNFAREKDAAGTLFFDYRNILADDRENWIIYGHRRNDGSMFGSLKKYAEEDYRNRHPNMYLLMEDRSYRVEIFACRTVRADVKYYPLWFDTDADYRQYLDKAQAQSYWAPDFSVGTDTPMLTLSTCSTDTGADDPRLLVHGRLVLIGEG